MLIYLRLFILHMCPGSNSQLGAFHSIKSSLLTLPWLFFFPKALSSFSRRQCAHSASPRRKHYCKCPPCFHFTQDRIKTQWGGRLSSFKTCDWPMFQKHTFENVNTRCNTNLYVTPHDLRIAVGSEGRVPGRPYALIRPCDYLPHEWTTQPDAFGCIKIR